MDEILLGQKYKIISKLGKGGFGTVYKVINVQTNRYYAVKMVYMKLLRKKYKITKF